MTNIQIREARIEPGERKASADGLKRFPATIATETPVRRRDYTGEFDEILSMKPGAANLERAPLPLLEAHDRSKVNIGRVDNIRLEGGKLRGDVVFGTSARGQELAADAEAGIVTGLSVAYSLDRTELDDSANPPRMTVTRFTPYEVSLTGTPADINSGIGRSTYFPSKEQHMSDKNTTDKSTTDEVRIAQAIERERNKGILKVCGALGDAGPAIAQRMISEGTSLPAARAAVIDELARRSDEFQIDGHHSDGYTSSTVTDDNRDKFVRGVSAAVFERSGTRPLIEQAKRKGGELAKVETDPGEFRGIGCADIARLCLERRGVSARHIFSKEKLFALALSQRSGGFSGTSDFAILFENVLHKQMRAAYDTQGNTWERWCGTDEVQDFKDASRFDLASFGTLDLKGENGEYKNKSIPDGAKKTIQTQTYGNIIGVSREMLINDDMGAMANLSTAFGKTGALTIEVAAYTLLNLHSGLGPYMTGTTPFFDDTAYANVSTGAALTATALDLDRQKMRLQQDLGANYYLDLVPRILLVNPTLEAAAKILNTDAFDPAQTGQKSNSARGMFDDIVTSPYLGTGTKRYLFSPNKEAFKVVFLAGQGRGPVMEMQNGWRTDGIEWKARLDAKVVPFDPKSAVYNAGT